MLNFKKNEKPKMPKEYVWELDYDGDIRIFKCVVTEDMVTTYEGDKECKHLKVMDQTCKQGVLQIDTITSIYGEQVSFQLERWIPYIKLQDGWESSDTTKQDRLDATVAAYKRNAKAEILVGIASILATIIKTVITGDMGDWYMLNVFGIFFIFAGISTRVRLKQELDAMKEAESEKEEASGIESIARKPVAIKAAEEPKE